MQTTVRSGQVFTRIVVPLLLFLLIVGGVAWVVVSLPSMGRDRNSQTPTQTLVKFATDRAIWDDNDKTFPREYEPGEMGEYDFPFENVSGKELEAGLDHAGCTCTEVKIALLPPGVKVADDPEKLKWIVLKKAGEKQAVDVFIPDGGHGLVRLVWKTKSEIGKASKLTAKVWFQPKGSSQSRQNQELQAVVRPVPPVLFISDREDVGLVQGQQSKTIKCWSATQDFTAKIDGIKYLDVVANPEPGFTFKIIKVSVLPDEAVKDFQKELEANKIMTTKAKSVATIEVTVDEKSKTGFLDQGHFSVRIPLLLKGMPFDATPAVIGHVHSDVRINQFRDGQIRLGKFSVGVGVKKSFIIEASPEITMLTLVRAPKTVDVQLEPFKEEGFFRWRLEIAVPKNTSQFPPVDNTITLRSQPTSKYLVNLAALVGEAGGLSAMAQLGALPSIASFTDEVIGTWSWKPDIRQVHMPLLGDAVQ